jgi:hypothetical protein
LTAPLAYYFGFVKKKIRRTSLLLWNFACLLLLGNIVVNAALSAPSPFQRLAFDQPNRAVLYFPFIWLPAFIVPVVLFAHLVSLRRLLFANRNTDDCKLNPEVALSHNNSSKKAAGVVFQAQTNTN